jgi:uncharacterized membrane protein
MKTSSHLWAIAYDSQENANRARDRVVDLAWGPGHYEKELILLDIAVIVRRADGSYTIDRPRGSHTGNLLASSTMGLIAGLVIGAPLTGAAIGALVGSAGNALSAAEVGIGDDFVKEVEAAMKPGAAALFVLDDAGDMKAILHAIQGLGGTVLKTNVDLERAKAIQEALAASPPTNPSAN